MPMNSKTNFVKSFMQKRKIAQKAGGKAFGDKPSPPTATWTCVVCGKTNLARREACDCGVKKPEKA
jgi:membrane protease subunit (stomatin/prohibitin family)